MMTAQEVVDLGRLIVFTSVIVIVALAVAFTTIIDHFKKTKLYKHLMIKID